MKNFSKKTGITIAIVLLLVIVLANSFVIIPTGYTGVRATFGQIDNTTVQNGFNLKIPFVQTITKVNNKQQDYFYNDGQIWSETQARTAIYYEGITVSHQINSEKSAWIYANVSDYQENLVSPGLISSAVKISSKGLSDVDATDRGIVEPVVRENLQKALDEKYGTDVVIVRKVTVKDVDFEESYNAAVAEKQKAQLAAEQQEIENKKAIEKAAADAEVKKTTAQAEAEAILIEAEAKAKANKLLEESLSDVILRQMYIDKWNGELPNVVAGEESGQLLIDIGGQSSQD